MEVFISWSGDRSEKVAEALRDWLPSVIQSIEPFMSASDIEKGTRWSAEIGVHLEKAQFGLICLTEENLEAPWLLFEAGALSKSIDNSRVVPYLYGVTPTQLQGPLAQFQAALASEEATLEVVKSINAASGEGALEPTRLDSTFSTWWPQLKEKLDSIPETTEQAPPSRSERDILEEILRLSRQMSRQGSSSLEIDQEMLRNRMAHGLHTGVFDSPEDLNAENPQSSRSAARRRRYELAMMRRYEERAMSRRLLEEHPNVRPSSESDSQSSSDIDN